MNYLSSFEFQGLDNSIAFAFTNLTADPGCAGNPAGTSEFNFVLAGNVSLQLTVTTPTGAPVPFAAFTVTTVGAGGTILSTKNPNKPRQECL